MSEPIVPESKLSPICRLCGEPVHVDSEGVVTHRDGLGSHDAEVAR